MTNNLDLSHVAAAQNQKEVTINDQAGQLDAALTAILTVLIDDTDAVTLTSAQLRRSLFFVLEDDSPAPDGAITITVPAIKRGLFFVINTTLFDATVEITGQTETAPTILAGTAALLISDGSDVRTAGGGGGAVNSIDDIVDVVITSAAQGQMIRRDGSNQWVNEDTPYDLGFFLPGVYSAGALMAQVVFDRSVSFPVDLAGSQGFSGVTATGSTILDIQKNGSNIGTITFTNSGNTATFVLAGGASFAAGDRLSILNENPADATLADLSLMLLGKRV
jgi:hypothetical protein